MKHIKLFESFNEGDFRKTLQYIFLDKKYKQKRSGEDVLDLTSIKSFSKEAVGKTFFVENAIGYEFEVKILDDKGTIKYRMIHPFHEPPLTESKTSSNDPEVFPSEEFAKATGIKWVTEDWKLPMNMTSDEAGAFVKQHFKDLGVKAKANKAAEELMQFYHEMLGLNPALKGLDQPKEWLNIIDHCDGVISKFIVDDINFFSSMSFPEKAHYNLGNRELKEKIAKVAGHGIYWVMSPASLKRITTELKIK